MLASSKQSITFAARFDQGIPETNRKHNSLIRKRFSEKIKEIIFAKACQFKIKHYLCTPFEKHAFENKQTQLLNRELFTNNTRSLFNTTTVK